MMTFTPKSEEQLAEENLLEKGTYDFTVMEATDQQAKKDGTPMIKLKLNLFTTNGSYHIYTYLHPSMEFLIRHFCATTNIMKVYESGKLDARACNDRSGRVIIGIEKAKDGYAAKNKVVDFDVPVATEPNPVKPTNAKAKEEPGSDDVPF